MADKKLSSVSPVSDMNYVYAETASGETVKISKADLASVVAELLPVASIYKKGLMPDSFIGGVSSDQPVSNLDINTFSTVRYNGTIIGDGIAWVILTRPCNTHYRIQEAYCLYPFARAWRAYVDGTWRSWQQY